MKTYKQYLAEEWSSYKGRHSHTADVKGHKVTVDIGKDDSGVHQVGYTINDRYNKDVLSWEDKKKVKPIDRGHAPLIARHAAMKVREFVAKNKPSKLKFSAFNKEHEPAFHKFAAKLAAVHGYKHETEEGQYGYGIDHVLTKMRKRKPKAE